MMQKSVRHWDEIFDTSDYKKCTVEMLTAKIKEMGLFDKSDIHGFTDNSDVDMKIATLATKAELKVEQDKIEEL